MLSPIQKEIVELPGNLIVRASAGTGKTHTMVSKIEYDNSNIENEYKKAFKKYNDNKIKIISYLLRKGYTYDEINNLVNKKEF